MARTEVKGGDGYSISRGLRESALWVFGALALILLVALSTYDAADPSYSSTGQSGLVVNLIGPFGAWISDFFFVLFGGPAFLFPLMLGYAGWTLFQDRRNQDPIDRRTSALRATGFVLALASSCGLATLHFDPGSLPNTAGGQVGALVGEGLVADLQREVDDDLRTCRPGIDVTAEIEKQRISGVDRNSVNEIRIGVAGTVGPLANARALGQRQAGKIEQRQRQIAGQ